MLYLKNAELTGQVLVNGEAREQQRDFFKKCSAYVMQDDALYAFLTVRSVRCIRSPPFSWPALEGPKSSACLLCGVKSSGWFA